MSTGIGARHYLRARVAVNVKKPLWSGCWILKSQNERVWVHFNYERLQGLCYKCGVFGHEHKHCHNPKVMTAYDKALPKYGPFITASKPRLFQRVPFGDAYEEGSNSNQGQHSASQSDCGSNYEHVNTALNRDDAVNVCSAENGNTTSNESLSQVHVQPSADAIPEAIHASTGMVRGEGVKLSQVVTHNAQGVMENISLPSGNRVFRKFTAKGYQSPPHKSNPPYNVEYPPEEGDPLINLEINIPTVVEDALSDKLAGGLNLERDREEQTLFITNGEKCVSELGGMKRARIIAVIDGQIITDATEMAEETGLPMPPILK